MAEESKLQLLDNLAEYKLHEFLGVHKRDGQGYDFAVWAPKAKAVTLVGDFNNWDTESTPLNFDANSGVWFTHVDNAKAGDFYKFRILGADNVSRYKADPYARQSELRPHDASVIYAEEEFVWSDQDFWNCNSIDFSSVPINIYEVHLGSWKREMDGSFLNYRELADQLVDYLIYMGYTHVELMPVMEHFDDASCGYSITSYFAPSARFGTVADLQYFVNKMHEHGIAVIADWVLAYFPNNDFALSYFDGSPCYEVDKEDERNNGRNKDYYLGDNQNILYFDFAKAEVRNFLKSSCYYWISKFHLDGIRMGSLDRILYKAHDHQEGHIDYHKHVNDTVVGFIQDLTNIIHNEFNGIMLVACETGDFPKVTEAVKNGGLGFDLKWDLTWSKDTLDYFSTDYELRKDIHNKLTYSMMYNFHERHVLPLAHNFVTHGRGSLIEKMPGDYWREFASMRLLYAYMMLHPGAKLMFMGGEIAQFVEWNFNEAEQWFLLDYDMHANYKEYVRELNNIYKHSPEFWEADCSWEGFSWLNADDSKHSTYSWYRSDTAGNVILCLFNMTPKPVDAFKLGVPKRGAYKIIFNSDDSAWGGSDYDPLWDVTKTKLNEKNWDFGEPLYDWKSVEFYQDDETSAETSNLNSVASSSGASNSEASRVVYSRDIANKNYDQSIKINLPPLAVLLLKFVQADPSKKASEPWPDPELPYPAGFNPYNKAADEGFSLI